MFGTQVKGKAKVGDKVTYCDVANQDGKVWTVVGLPIPTSYGFMTDYELVDDEGNKSTSSLRTNGWTFADH